MAREGWIAVGRLADIPRRGARRIRSSGEALPIAIFRTGGDEIFALVDRCPHRGGPLSEGIVQGCTVACPLHGWVITLQDGKAEAPDEGGTQTIPVRLSGDRVLISASAIGATAGLDGETA